LLVLIYPIHLYRTLRNKDRVAAEVGVGLVLVGLGAASILVDMLCHAGFLLTVAGFFMLTNGLKRIMPHLSKHLFFSSIMLAATSLLVYLVGLHMLGLVRPVFFIVFMGSYILSLAALAALWPALKILRRNLGDHILSLSLNLLISGWILAPLLIPLVVAALSYAIIIVRMPHKLICLRKKILTPI